MIAKVLRYGFILFLVAAVASASLAATYELTKDEIARQRFLQQVRAVQQVIKGADKPEYVKKRTDLAEEAAQEFAEVGNIFEVKVDGKTIGYAVQVSPKGYGGPMAVVVGISTEGEVTGVVVIEHKETPGLGSEVVENEKFLQQYQGKRPEDPVEVGVDIDARSGATISSKGVTEGVRTALAVYREIISRSESR